MATTKAKPRTARASKPAQAWGYSHPLAKAYLAAMPKGATLVGAHGKPGAKPNAKGELLCKLDGTTVAYISLAGKGTMLHAERSLTGLQVNGAPRAVAQATVRQYRAHKANAAKA